jgi:hypothetical protein
MSVDKKCADFPGVLLLDEKKGLSFVVLWVFTSWSSVPNCFFWYLSVTLHTYKALCPCKRSWKFFHIHLSPISERELLPFKCNNVEFHVPIIHLW